MKNLRNSILGFMALSLALPFVMSVMAGSAIAGKFAAKTVVLVHGALADGSSWSRVIPLLQKAGLKVSAVQNPLESLKGDVASTNRAIERAEGPVVLVGHSWGGVVITQAGVHKKVKSLVYVAAMAPSQGQNLMEVTAGQPTAEGFTKFEADDKGYLTLSAQNMKLYLAQELSDAEIQVLAAVQGPWNSAALGDKVSVAAWTKKPSWYAVAENDKIIHPDLQKAFVKKLNAKSIAVKSSHLPMIAKPQEIANLIIEAAK